MKRITILTACADGHSEPYEACQSRSMQTVPNERVFISRPKNEDHHKSENKCRNIARKYATGKYTIFMDSDVVMTSPTDIEDAIAWMREHPEYDAGAYNTKPGSAYDPNYPHVCVAWMIVRTEVLLTREWRFMPGNCSCTPFGIDNRIAYIDDRIFYEIERKG